MGGRKRAAALAAGLSGALLLSGMVVAPADATSRPPTITATMTSKAVSLSTGHWVRSGRVMFKVTSPAGSHTLQLLKLGKGYSFKQATADVQRSFGGDVAAIRRVDRNITFFGGAEATPGHPGYFAETLYAGVYYAIDQESNAWTTIHVSGRPAPRGWIPTSSTITMYNYGFGGPSRLPRTGWTLVRDHSDEPHFVVLQQVKPGTTAKDVQAYVDAHTSAEPSWLMPASASSGVISAGVQVEWHYALPAGRYVMACFWPDDRTGMPHMMMGMWKVVDLT